MITKEGIVTKTKGSMVWIQTTRSKACESCASQDSCGAHSRTESITVKLENSFNVSTGDRVIVGFRTASLLKIAFILYIFPIIFMILGAAVGNSIAVKLNIDISITSIFFGFLCFISSFLIIRCLNNILSGEKEYQPFLIRLIQRGSSPYLQSCSVKTKTLPFIIH